MPAPAPRPATPAAIRPRRPLPASAAAVFAYLLVSGAALANPVPRPAGTGSVPPLTDGPMARPAMLRGPPPGAVIRPVPPPSGARAPAQPSPTGWLNHRNPRAPEPLHIPERPQAEPGFINHNVFGDDDRVPVINTLEFPYRAVVKLYFERSDAWYGCSGFVVQPDIVMTAGHCIFGYDERDFALDILIIPAMNGGLEWFGRWDWEEAWVRDEWQATRAWGYDVGFIRVRGNLGELTGQFGTAAVDDETILAAQLYTAGYPGSTPTQMHQTSCRADPERLSRLKVEHFCDAEEGQSGSPYWLRHGDDPHVVIGVHSYHRVSEPIGNGAARLSDDVHAWYADQTGLCENACVYGTCREDTGELCTVEAVCTELRPGRCAEGYTCVDTTCTCAEDRYEPDDTPDDAQVLLPGEIRGAMICQPGGSDLYRLDLAAGQTATFQVTFSHDEGDIDTELLDAAGEVVAEAATFADEERLTFTAEVDGRWHFRVFGFDGAEAGYTIELIGEGGPPAADPEPDPPVDAAMPDARITDAGPPDAAPPADAAPRPDAGPRPVDAEAPDADPPGTPDTGVRVVDRGAPGDGGPFDPEADGDLPGGCDVTRSTRNSTPWAFFFLALVARSRRRAR